MSYGFNPFTGNFDAITDVSVTTVGASPNTNGATVVQTGASAALTLQPADGSHPGLITSGTQTLGGAKTLTAALSLSSNQIHNVTDPTGAQDAATKAYVDAAVAALQPATAVYAATVGSNLTGTYNNGVSGVGATFIITATGAFTLDGTTPPVNSRILIKDQSSGFQNGIYNLTVAGTTGVSPVLTRSLDYNTAADMNQAGLIPVINGIVNALSSWQQTAVVNVVGTDPLVFQEFTANPSLYLLKANNLNDVASKSTSFNNLSPVTTTGDLIYSASAATNTRLAVGSTGNVLTVAGGVPTWAPPATAGTVTAVSVVSTNGFAGTSSGGATPALTLTTTITGILQGNGTAISAASTTGSGAVVLATSPTLVTPALGTPSALVLTNATGLPTTALTGTLQTAQFPALTGDITTTAGALATTLATVNSNVGSFTNANVTVNAKGLITAVSNGSAGSLVAPTIQRFVSGSGTYTTPSSPTPLYLRIRMVGAGGGGAGSGSATGTASGSGGASTWKTAGSVSILTCNGGTGAIFNSNGGVGGTAVVASPAIGTGWSGASGAAGVANNNANPKNFNSPGGQGGSSALGGAGASVTAGTGGTAMATTGSGGAGGGTSQTPSVVDGGGGGAGAYIEALISSPSSTYLYAVGAAGSGGGAGTSGLGGGAGGTGIIEITEYYQ